MSQTAWVYTCDGTRNEATNPLAFPGEAGTCSPASSGQWVELTIPDPVPIMDLISIGIVVGMAFCVVAGFIAGQQR